MNKNLEKTEFTFKSGHWEFNFESETVKWTDSLKTLLNIDLPMKFTDWIALVHPNYRYIFSNKIRCQKEELLEYVFKLDPAVASDNALLLCRTIPIYDSEQGIVGVNGFITKLSGTVVNERLYEGFFNLDSVGNIIMSESGIITKCNPKFIDLLGYESKNIIGKSFLGFLDSNSRIHVTKLIRSYFHDPSKTPKRYIATIVRPSGEKLKVKISANIITGHNLMVKSIEDISKQESESLLFKTVFDLPHAGQAIISNDLKLIKCNDEFKKIIGYTDEDLQKSTIKSIFPSSFNDLIKSLNSNQSFDGDTLHQSFQTQITNKNGHLIWLKVHAERIAETPMSYITIEDITGQIANQQELVETIHERDSFRDALNRSALVSITNLSGKIIYVNDEFVRTSGYTREELMGRDHRILNSGYHPRDFWIEAWKNITSGKPWRGEVKNKSKDGTYYWVDTTINPMKNESGKTYQYMSVRYLITDRKVMEERQQKLLKDLSDYAFMTSHELRGPLARMLGLLNLIKMNENSPEELNKYLALIEATSKELDVVIKKMNTALSRSSFETLVQLRDKDSN